jgi:hypothetical protein
MLNMQFLLFLLKWPALEQIINVKSQMIEGMAFQCSLEDYR